MTSRTIQRTISIIAAAAVALFALLLLLRWMIGRASPPPTTLGVQDGRLAPCPDKPNCVSSFADATDKEHAIAPLRYATSRAQAHEALVNVLYDQPRSKVITTNSDYIHATFRSNLMRFRDDGEFLFDENEPVIHVRMGARLGYEDMDANRKRVEEIRTAFNTELGQE
jgi:uncharacterized protein (DUF1499 family)